MIVSLSNRTLGLAVLSLALGLCLLLRLPFSSVKLFNVDEAVSAVAAYEIAQGNLPYRDAVDHRGPLTYYVYGASFALFGDWNMTAVHQVYVGIVCLICLLVFDIGRRVRNLQTGAMAALFLAIFSWTNAPMDTWAAHTEWLMILFSSLGIWFYLWCKESIWGIFWAALCFGVAILSKQVAVWEVLVLAIFPFLMIQDLKNEWKAWFVRSAMAAILFLIPAGLFLCWFWQKDALSDFIQYFWIYNVKIYMPEVNLAERLLSSGALILGFFGNKLLLAALILVTLLHRLGQLKQDRQKVYLIDLILCWFLLGMIGALTSGRNFPHYMIQILPSATILAAWSLQEILGPLFNKNKAYKTWGSLILILGLVLPMGNTLVQNLSTIRELTALKEIPDWAVYIQQHSDSLDPIFVWGFAPEPYVLCERPPASRFSFCNFLTGFIPWENIHLEETDDKILPGSWEQLMFDFGQEPPKFILDASVSDHNFYGKYPMTRYKPLNDFVETFYQSDTTFQNSFPDHWFHLYVRQDK